MYQDSRGIYREGGVNTYLWQYDDVKKAFQDELVQWFVETENKPLYVGEYGPYAILPSEPPYVWESAENGLKILNEWGISYNAMWWWPGNPSDGPYALYNLTNFQPTSWGLIVQNAFAEAGINLTYPVNITGIVTDSETSLPIEGATVTCNSFSATTNSTGGYFIMMSTPAPGSCTLTATKTGFYTPKSISFVFNNNQTYTGKDFSLEPVRYNIAGRLMDKYGNPLTVTITIYQEDTTNVVNSTSTDLNGDYDVSALPGTYDIQFDISDFYIKLLDVDLTSDINNPVNYVNSSSDKLAFDADITTEQMIEVLSSRPNRILLNSSEIEDVTSLPLRKNTWYHSDSSLYLNISSDLMANCLAKFKCCKNEIRYYNKDCPDPATEYCSNRICYDKQECPAEFECCENEEMYLDKICPSGLVCSNRICTFGLVAEWNFDDCTATDSSGSGNDGTIYGATCVIGKSGNALSFDGSDDYVDYGTSSDFDWATTDNFTYEFWLKTTEIDGMIISQRSSTSGNPVLDIAIGFTAFDVGDGEIGFLVRGDNAAGLTSLDSNTVVNDGNWHHVTITRNVITDEYEVFIDGVSKGTITDELTDSITTNMRAIASERRWVQESASTPDRRYFNGTIDEVRIYNRSLTADEILAHASA